MRQRLANLREDLIVRVSRGLALSFGRWSCAGIGGHHFERVYRDGWRWTPILRVWTR